jgi:hypothetical protein
MSEQAFQNQQAVENDGFFNDLADVETGVKDGKYPAYVTKSEIITKKDASKAWVITYRIADGAQKGENVQEWFNTYPGDAEKNENAKKWRKRRIMDSFGVPESMVPSFQPGQIVGEYVIIGVKNSGNFTNVSSVVRADERTGLPINATPGSAPAPGTVAPGVTPPAAAPSAPSSAADVSSLL